MKRLITPIFIAVAAIFASALWAISCDPAIKALPRIYYVTFQSLDSDHALTVAAQFRLPWRKGKMPAVVIVHDTEGINGVGNYYAEASNNAGIATLEIDMWTARGLMGLVAGRPKTVPETLPDAYGAFRYLSGRPDIDAERIGIMGFSFGGVVSMLTATNFYTEKYLGHGPKFAAHVPFYPSCWLYNRVPGYEFKSFTGAPIFIQSGAKDVYDDPDTCSKLVKSLPEADQKFISIKLYPDATHEWNRLQPSVTYYDPAAYKGKGGEVTIIPNPRAAEESRLVTLQFFERVFSLPKTDLKGTPLHTNPVKPN